MLSIFNLIVMKRIFILLFFFCSLNFCFGQTNKVKSSEDYLNEGIFYASQAKYFDAIVKFSKAIELNPNSGDYYKRRGRAKNDLSDYRGSKDDYTKAISINPSDTLAYVQRAFERMQLNDELGSIDDCSKAIKVNPHYAFAYRARGLSKIRIGQKESGCLDLSKAGELGDESAYRSIQRFCNK